MKKFIILILFLVLALTLGSSQSIYDNCEIYGNCIEPITFDNNTAFVNSSGIWVTTSLGPLSDANSTQFESNGGVLTAVKSWWDGLYCQLTGCTMTGDIDMDNNNINNVALINGFNISDDFIRKVGDTIPQKNFQLNFSFSNTSLPGVENNNNFIIKNLNESSANTITAENDNDISVSLFTSGSNFLTGLNLNNSAGIAATNTNLILATRSPERSIIMQVINATGSTIDTLIIEGNGNVIMQNNLVMNLSSIFLDDLGDRFIKVNSEGLPFNGIATNATWFAHNNPRANGSITFLSTVENDTVAWTTSLQNHSFSLLSGNSGGLVPSYMAQENFTEIDGTFNMTKASDYIFLCNFFGVDCNFNADTRGNAIDDIPGGPLLFTMGDLEIWQSAKIHRGLAVEDAVVFDLIGNDFNVNNGSIHIATPVTFQQGFTSGDSVTKFSETFAGSLGIFSNIQSDLGDWLPVLNSVFCDEGECAQADGAGSGLVQMQANVSTSDINQTRLSFVYSLVNLIGSGDFSIEVNNNVGSGDVEIFSDTTDNVVKSIQSIVLPSSMDNQSLVTITIICDISSTNKPGRQCYFDTAKLNGTAISTTLINVSGFNSQVCAGDGTKNSEGVCNNGWFYNASANAIFPQGAWNLSGSSIVGVSHSALTNLEWASAGHTFTSPNQVMDIGSYNLTTTGQLVVRQGEDFGGIKIFGFDDRSANFMRMFVDTAGQGGLDADKGWEMRVNNDIRLLMGSTTMTLRSDLVFDGARGKQDIFQRVDGAKHFFGAADDAYITYGEFRSNLEIQADNVGSGGVTIGQTVSSGSTFNFQQDGSLLMNERGFAQGGVLDQRAKISSDTIFVVQKMALDRGQGTGGIGMGLKWQMLLENGGGNRHEAGGITLEWDDPTADSEFSRMTLETYENGSAIHTLMLSGSNALFHSNITVGSRVIFGNNASIGFNATCAFIFYNQTGSVIDTKGCV